MAKGKTQGKRINLKSAKLVDGKTNTPDVDTNVRTIDEILGVTTSNPFRANSLAEFEKLIDEDMNLADMQALATRVGLLPVHDRVVLKQRLISEYKKDRVKRMPYDINGAVNASENLKEEGHQKAKRILNEGR